MEGDFQIHPMAGQNLSKVLLLVVLLSIPAYGFSQKIDNIQPEISGDKIHICYDLTGISTGQQVVVKVYLSTDGGKTYGDPLSSVSGDVGLLTGPGEGRCIIWDVFRDRDELLSVAARFRVTADLIVSQQYSTSGERSFRIELNPNLGSRGILESKSYGLNLKGMVYFNRFGLGLRGGYYHTFRPDINYSDGLVTYADTGYYWGYAGGAIIEYDLLSNDRYSLYPFLYIGQSKVLYEYNPDYKEERHFKYSIFGSLGLGADYRVNRFLYLGMELEYVLSPWFDVVPSNALDEGLDGFCLGLAIKFLLHPGK